MIAFVLVFTLSVDLKERKMVLKNQMGKRKNNVINKKEKTHFASGDPIDSENCYAAYLVVHNGLEFTEKIKGQIISKSKDLKFRAVTADQIDALKTECAATAVAGGACETALTGIDTEAVKAGDQKAFKDDCEIENPSPVDGGDDDVGAGDVGNNTFKISNLLFISSILF
jgi:hypothetical protein